MFFLLNCNGADFSGVSCKTDDFKIFLAEFSGYLATLIYKLLLVAREAACS